MVGVFFISLISVWLMLEVSSVTCDTIDFSFSMMFYLEGIIIVIASQ